MKRPNARNETRNCTIAEANRSEQVGPGWTLLGDTEPRRVENPESRPLGSSAPADSLRMAILVGWLLSPEKERRMEWCKIVTGGEGGFLYRVEKTK